LLESSIVAFIYPEANYYYRLQAYRHVLKTATNIQIRNCMEGSAGVEDGGKITLRKSLTRCVGILVTKQLGERRMIKHSGDQENLPQRYWDMRHNQCHR
jgi:hypothetical protein